MSKLLIFALLLPVFAAGLAPRLAAGQDDEEPPPDGNKLVKVHLLADREAIAPGSAFTLAVRFAIEPRWHVYWENPGDSGIPTRAEITAPPGFEVGPLRFPPPHRDEQPGDIIQYIHENELVVLADVRAPKDLAPGTRATFSAKGKWLVCTDICVAGAGESTLEIPVADAEKPARAKEFATWRAKLPRPWSELARARSLWSGDEAAPKLQVIVPGATALEFFPSKSATTQLTKRTVDAGKQGATLNASFGFERKKPEDQPMARGVLWVKTNEGEACYVLDQPFAKQ